MTVTLEEQYKLKQAASRRIVTIGNRIGSTDEYGTLVDRDMWLWANLSRRPIVNIGSRFVSATSARAYTMGEEICDVHIPVSQPAHGVGIIAQYQCDAAGDERIQWEVIDGDSMAILGTGTMVFSATTVTEFEEFTFIAPITHLILKIRCVGTVVSRDVNVYGLHAYELSLIQGDLPP